MGQQTISPTGTGTGIPTSSGMPIQSVSPDQICNVTCGDAQYLRDLESVFKINKNANGVTLNITGDLNITGSVNSNNNLIAKNITSGSITSTGDITGSTITSKGSLTSGDITSTGTIKGSSVYASGTISAGNSILSPNLTAIANAITVNNDKSITMNAPSVKFQDPNSANNIVINAGGQDISTSNGNGAPLSLQQELITLQSTVTNMGSQYSTIQSSYNTLNNALSGIDLTTLGNIAQKTAGLSYTTRKTADGKTIGKTTVNGDFSIVEPDGTTAGFFYTANGTVGNVGNVSVAGTLGSKYVSVSDTLSTVNIIPASGKTGISFPNSDGTGGVYIGNDAGILANGKITTQGGIIAGGTSSINDLNLYPTGDIIIYGNGTNGIAMTTAKNNIITSGTNSINYSRIQPTSDGNLNITGNIFAKTLSASDTVATKNLSASDTTTLGGNISLNGTTNVNNNMYINGNGYKNTLYGNAVNMKWIGTMDTYHLEQIDGSGNVIKQLF